MSDWDDDFDDEPVTKGPRNPFDGSSWDDDDSGPKFSLFGPSPTVKSTVENLKESLRRDRRDYGTGPVRTRAEGVWFQFDLRGIEGTTGKLNKIAKALENWKPFFRHWFLPAYLMDMQLQFESEGQFVGGWDGLDPSYQRWKQKHYPGRLILQRSRKLVRSFFSGGRSKYLNVQITERNMRLTNLLPYAKFVNVERKIMIPQGRLNKARYRKILNDYLKEVIRRSGA